MNCEKCGNRMENSSIYGGFIWICPKCGHKVIPVVSRPSPSKPKIEKHDQV